jgi:type VI secretion system secreted protein VgrG
MPENPFHFRPYLVATDLDAGVLRATRIVAREQVSRGCEYQVFATCDYGAVEVRELLRKPAAIVVAREDGSIVRRLGGFVTKVSERASTVVNRQEVRVVIEDPLALLRYSSDHRIFQEKTTREIVQTILDESGIPSSEFRLSGASRKREVCTQYGETMRAFVDRILEEDGIHWFVEQGEDGAKVVFGDGPSSWSETPFDKTIRYRHGAGLHPDETLDSIHARARVRPKKVTLRAHDFAKPTLDLEAAVESDTVLGREHYEYPGRHRVAAEGKARAKAILDAHVAQATATKVSGRVFRMTAGHVFDLEETPGQAHDGAFVALEVVHEWSHLDNARLETTATILEKSAPYAPEPRTPKPRALGDLALVTTPSGQEIHTDEHGRIKAQFHWDRHSKPDDKSSGWIRVGQMHTSGSVVVPRVGWELLVEYEDGDPDRPIVLGRLWNQSSPPTDPLPGGATNSTLVSYTTPGGSGRNELRMNDGGGSELVRVHAQKDLNLVVANDKKEKVTTSADIGVKVDEKIKVGANETTKVGSMDEVEIGGSQTYKVAAARTKTITKDEKVDVKGDRSVTIAASHTTTTPKSIDTSTKGNLSETVGGSCMEVAALDVGLAVAGSASITVGGAKVEAVATGKSDLNIGAKATTIGGAFLNVTPKDVTVATKNSKATTVGGAWLATSGAEAEISSKDAIDILVGGAIAFNAASKIVLKVGGSTVTVSGGSVVLESKEVKLTASGPAAELAPMVGSK